MSQAIATILFRNLSELNGTRISGTIPVNETVMNTAINRTLKKRGPLRAVDIQIGTGNHLEVGMNVAVGPLAKWFRPEVVIERQSASPTIVMTLASAGYAGMLRLAELLARDVLPGGIVIRGRQIIIDLAAIPLKSEYRSLVDQVRSLDIQTIRGKLFLNFELEINE